MKRLFIILITMLFCGVAWSQISITKQAAPRWVFLKMEWNGLGMAPLVGDSAHWQAWHHYPTDTVFNSGRLRTLTSANWVGLSNGLVAFKDTFALAGPHVVTIRDSVILGIGVTGDATTPFTAFTVSTLPCDVTGWSARWRNGKNRGKVFYICAHDTSAGASADSLVICENAGSWGAAIWANADSIQANDTLELSRGEWAFVVNALDSSAGGGADTAAIRAMMLTATIQRADTTGVAETLLAGGSTGSDTTNIKAALATAHGAGSWLTATGFAVPGSAMSLTAGERDSLDNRQHAQAKKDTIKHVTEIGDDDNIATKVWSSGTRTLTAFSLLTAFDIWTYATRTLTPTGNAQIAESTWTHSPRTLTAGSGSDTTAIGTMLDNRYGINDSTLRTQGVSALGANLLAILALSTADSTPIGGVLATVSDLAFSSAHTWAETNVSGLVRFSLAPDTIGLTAARPTYSTTTDTIIVTGPVTDTLWLAPPPVPIPTSPGRCTVWGDVYNLGTTPSNPRYQVMAYVQPGEQPQYSDSAAVSTNKIIATADSTGRWSLELLQGVKIQIEIPVAGVRRVGTVPASTTANYMSFTATR